MKVSSSVLILLWGTAAAFATSSVLVKPENQQSLQKKRTGDSSLRAVQTLAFPTPKVTSKTPIVTKNRNIMEARRHLVEIQATVEMARNHVSHLEQAATVIQRFLHHPSTLLASNNVPKLENVQEATEYLVDIEKAKVSALEYLECVQDMAKSVQTYLRKFDDAATAFKTETQDAPTFLDYLEETAETAKDYLRYLQTVAYLVDPNFKTIDDFMPKRTRETTTVEVELAEEHSPRATHNRPKPKVITTPPSWAGIKETAPRNGQRDIQVYIPTKIRESPVMAELFGNPSPRATRVTGTRPKPSSMTSPDQEASPQKPVHGAQTRASQLASFAPTVQSSNIMHKPAATSASYLDQISSLVLTTPPSWAAPKTTTRKSAFGSASSYLDQISSLVFMTPPRWTAPKKALPALKPAGSSASYLDQVSSIVLKTPPSWAESKMAVPAWKPATTSIAHMDHISSIVLTTPPSWAVLTAAVPKTSSYIARLASAVYSFPPSTVDTTKKAAPALLPPAKAIQHRSSTTDPLDQPSYLDQISSSVLTTAPSWDTLAWGA